MPPSTSSDRTTAAVTRPPARATVRTSTPSPSAAIDTTVSRVAACSIAGRAAGGLTPSERRTIIARKPWMNHGTRWWTGG